MAEPDSEVLKIADEVGLTASDINSIQSVKRRRKFSNTSLYLVESLIGIASFLIGYTVVPIKVIELQSSYPFGSVLLFSPLIVLSNSVKRRSILRLIAVTLFVCILSILLGSITGQLFNSTSVPFGGSSVRYGVFTND
ncbi:MAG: hypothetical protein ACXAB2_05120 [Candidatus Hodarchaeales archaeon]|jgi:hypothetical protein